MAEERKGKAVNMNWLEEAVNILSKLGPEMFCVVSCIAFGYVIRLIPAIPNKWIPAACILFAPLVYPFLTSPGRVSPDSVNPMMRIVLTGLVLGVSAFILHDKVISHIESKIPGLRKVLKQSDDTKQFRRDAKGAAVEMNTEQKENE